ncbi:glycoside hydrolase family 26 protein [Gordonia sp. DT30]|uniref:glycoside hydrolase family 26 protein n=1 Tax=Gordonia sp. DT30 TaxID=3416546 RepID=UPI003CE91613
MDSPDRPPRSLSRGIRRRDLLRLGALGTVGLVAACASDRQVTPAPATPPPALRPWGAFIPSVLPAAGSTRSPLQQLATLAGAPPKYVHRFAAIGDPVPTAELDAIATTGATPLLTLEPWRPDGGVDQPDHSLARIAAGAFDTQFASWADGLASWGKPVLLRFAQEMNGTWYPWSIGVNGNTAADYRAAWARMHSVMHEARIPSVQFVWAPNVLTPGTNPFADAYPGSDLVDVLGLDGYNWGEQPGHHWQAATDLFAPSLDALREIDGTHPILVTEVASADGPSPEDKAGWIRDFFTLIQSQSRVEGFVWFQMDKERDWRFNSTPASTAAFRAGVAGLGLR